MKKILAVFGPTAVGKTTISLDLAKCFNGEIISCDSMQIYRGMDIGSAKPSKEEQESVPHHLIDIVNPGEDFSVAKYYEYAASAIDDISGRGNLPILSGGTGLYMDAVIYNMDFAARPPENSLRDYYYEIAHSEGPNALYEMLKEKDPDSAERIHPNNVKRVVRALESATEGLPIKDFSSKPERRSEYDVVMIGLMRQRDELYDRINKRVDIMMSMGLLQEVERLIESGCTSDMIAMKGIGYKELIAYLKGETSLDDAVTVIKTNSRHYAKRQITWLKKYGNYNEDHNGIKWFDLTEIGREEKASEEIMEWLGKRL